VTGAGSQGDRESVHDALVVEMLPGAMIRVKLTDGEELTAHVAEELRRVTTPVRPGDKVRVRRAERDPKRATIVAKK
jgi:translation initiation factor IF-1